MKKTPLISDGKTPLVWRDNPNGGQYAGYKLGIIFRHRGKYSYKTSYNQYFNATGLKDAKAKIDKYTDSRMKELREKKKNHQIKRK